MSSHLQPSKNREFLKFEYHVIYSFSYSVPVLYFTASRQGILKGSFNLLHLNLVILQYI